MKYMLFLLFTCGIPAQVVTTNSNWSGKPELKGKFIPADAYLDANGNVQIVGGWITPKRANALNDQAIEDFYDPEFEQADWKNGDDCIYKSGDEDVICKFIAMHPKLAGLAIVWNEGQEEIDCIVANMLSKPETPEQKKERELLETAHELYNKSTGSNVSFDYFDNKMPDKNVTSWIKAAEITGYRKPDNRLINKTSQGE